MADKEKSPKLEFPTNIPQTFKLGKMFKEGESEYGPWYGYSVEKDGKEHVFFAKAALHEKLLPYEKGTTLTVTFAEKKREDGKSYHQWEVTAPMFDDNGKGTPEPPPDPLVDEKENSEARNGRKTVMYQALLDAKDVVAIYNNAVESPEYRLKNEDIRAIGISFAINWERRHG